MKFAAYFFIAVAALSAGCAGEGTVDPALAAILAPEPDSTACLPWSSPGVTPPEQGCQRLKVRPIGGSIGAVFNDRNDVHLEHASRIGIVPVAAPEQVWTATQGLVKIRSGELYYVDRLTHSYPYLTREAADLLDEIGSRFRDSLAARGGGAYRPKVTSVLRTEASVGRLRRVNRNATAVSAHCFGTTFDISHSKFICDDSTATGRTFEDLKNLLAEIIADLRAQGRCVVKHERRQACFHITVCAPTISPSFAHDSDIQPD